MTDFLSSVDDRTNLAGTNRLELLTFHLSADKDGQQELFGINVFKVREILQIPEITPVPQSPDCLAGYANIRGRFEPAIDLCKYCGFDADENRRILVVTEFNGGTQGFLVHDVDNILQLAWSQITTPPDLVGNIPGNLLTAMSQLDDGRMLMIIDVERVIADVLGSSVDNLDDDAQFVAEDERMVFFVDDSRVARAQVQRLLERMHIPCKSATNGEEALHMLQTMAAQAAADGVALSTRIKAIVTDVEMPRMDGYVLTRKLKEDNRFENIPVMMHSSLSARENQRLGMKVGADAYVAKLDPETFTTTLHQLYNAA